MFNDLLQFLKDNTGNIITSFVSIVIIILIIVIIRLITLRSIKKAKNARIAKLADVINSILKYVSILILILTLLTIWDFNTIVLLIGMGIIVLIVGFGSLNLINDLLSGVTLVFGNAFDVDEVIEIDGFKGRVTYIGLRSTRLVNTKGEEKYIANGDIRKLINYSRNFSMAEVSFTIKHKENITLITSILEEKLPQVKELFPEIIEGPNVIGLTQINSSGSTIKVTAKTLPEMHYAVERQLMKMIKDILEENNIEIAVSVMEIRNER